MLIQGSGKSRTKIRQATMPGGGSSWSIPGGSTSNPGWIGAKPYLAFTAKDIGYWRIYGRTDASNGDASGIVELAGRWTDTAAPGAETSKLYLGSAKFGGSLYPSAPTYFRIVCEPMIIYVDQACTIYAQHYLNTTGGAGTGGIVILGTYWAEKIETLELV